MDAGVPLNPESNHADNAAHETWEHDIAQRIDAHDLWLERHEDRIIALEDEQKKKAS